MNKYFSFKMASNSNYKTIGIGGGEVLTQYWKSIEFGQNVH